MKRVAIIFALILLLSSVVSAEIIFTQPVSSVYNLGDSIFVPVKIKTLNDVSGIFQMNLICNGTEINFYKNGIKLTSGEEKSLDSSLVLINQIIGDSKGQCRVKAILNAEYVLSNEFKISDWLNIAGGIDKTEYNTGEIISISGKVAEETGENSNGFLEAEITGDVNQDIRQSGTVTDGLFSMNISIPSNLKAGNYFIELRAYELSSEGLTTNQGSAEYNFSVRQVPTNLELVIENKEINPGEYMKVRAVLHDQTGEAINSTAFITLKDSSEKIIEQEEINLSDSFEYFIKPNEPPAEWTVYATSNKLTAEDKFSIKEKESADIQIINKTIVVTNTGNILYNKTLLVRVGDSPLNIQVTLNVGESKKYIVNAPDGEYNVRISTGEDNEVNQTMSLTGNAVGIKEASGIISWSNVFWVLVVLVLAYFVFIFSRKIYKKPFFGKVKINFLAKPKKEKEVKMLIGEDLKMVPKTGNKAELSLSIKGDQQDASIVCLKIKNLREMKYKKSSPSEAISKIIDLVEDNKGATYENQDYLFFIFAPLKTKTMKNEKIAVEIAERIQGILSEHNRKFNQKMDFGISLNYGTIVVKIEDRIFKFMTMGSLMSATKKIAALSNGEVLLSDKINDSLRLQQVKTEKEMRDGTSVFVVREIKKENEEARKFINRFMERQGKE